MNKRPAELPAKRWLVQSPIPKKDRQNFSDINPIMLQVLFNRGLTDHAHIRGFLDKQYLAQDDPFLLADMDTAVARITTAIENDERIVIYGDFDADGVTSTVLLTKALRGLGVARENTRPHIPDRVDEGYGLNRESLTRIKSEFEADLVITVDCGIRSVDEVIHANEIGLDMIITDHHSIGDTLPPAIAVINPKRKESDYPDRDLAGVGVAYKLAAALHTSLADRSTINPTELLDLVAIGTVADLVPLLGENRKLVSDGLAVLNRMQRPGITALAQVAKIKENSIASESIAFGLAPRINAAGRLAHAYDAAKLLAAPSGDQARVLAQTLEGLNRQRQALTQELALHAETLVDPDAPILIVNDKRFISGIVGLVASRLMDNHYRPAIVMERGETESRGSCRSIPEFHITHALEQVSHLLVRYGGHAQAAGFTIANENIEPFCEAMTEIADDMISHLDLTPTIQIDANIALHDVDYALLEHLDQLEPTGQANRPPLFMSENVQVINYRVVGRDKSHLQIEVADGMHSFKAIAFRQAAWAADMPPKIDIAYTIGVNEFRGNRTLQLKITDIRLPSKREQKQETQVQT